MQSLELVRCLYRVSVPSPMRDRIFVWRREVRRGLVKSLAVRGLLQVTAARRHDLSRTLVIAGSARSGTTWLAELISMVPRTAFLFEPLNLDKHPEGQAAGFDWCTYFRPGDDRPAAEAFLRRALSGQVRSTWTTKRIPLRRAMRPRNWVVKFIRVNMLLEWMVKRFPIPTPLFVIRHPCAVVSSIMGYEHWQPPELSRRFLAEHPHFQKFVNGLATVEELRAAQWCLENYVPLSIPQPRPIHVVSYEELVRGGEGRLAEVFRLWELPVPDAARRRMRRPSTTTAPASHLCQGGDPLAGWRDRLESAQVDRILRVIERFGLDFYTDALEPDYARLHGPQPIRDGLATPIDSRSAE